MRHRFWTILVALFVFSGCGGGDGGSSSSAAPSITNIVLLYGETGMFDARIYYADQNGDAATLTTVLYDAKGAPLSTTTSPIPDAAAHPPGTVQKALDFSSLPPGGYSVALHLTNREGKRSNVISKNFSTTGTVGSASNYPSDRVSIGDTAIGDLNGDGRNDVVAIRQYSNSGDILIYYQNSTGTFNTPVHLDPTITVSGVAIADVNNDGRADLVLAGTYPHAAPGWQGRIVVFLQDQATGQFLPVQKFTVSSNAVSGVAVADLNMDGRKDVVVVAQKEADAGTLAIFFQSPGGSLSPEVVYDKSPVWFQGEVHLADMNNDGKTDIVVQSGPLEFAVIRQTVPGEFSPHPEIYTVQTSYWPNFYAFALGDVNGDSLIDVVVSDIGNNGLLNVFLQNPQGTLSLNSLIQTDGAFGVEIADITGDGLNDIIYDISPGMVVFPQQPDHTFGPDTFFRYDSTSVGGSFIHQALSIGDVTGDGRPDAVVTWSHEGLFVFPYRAQLQIN